MCEVKEIIEKK